MTHIPRYPSSNIWGAIRHLPLIMFEIRLYFFHTLEMQRGEWTDSKGACFRNIYYPIKMGTSESSNYLQTVSGMMNGMEGLFSPTCIHLWCAGGLHLSTPSGPPPSSDYESTSESRRVLGWVMVWVFESVWEGLGVFALLENSLSDTGTFSPHSLRWRWGSNRGGDSGRGASHVNEDIVWLSLIKMFPQGCRIHGLIKNVIADVIKRCVMIHDNNYAAGKTTAHDLINVHDTGKSIPGFITDKSWQTQELSTDTDQNMATDDTADNLYTAHVHSQCDAVTFS